jgi:hypothetical protein
VQPGINTVGELQVTASGAWNSAPRSLAPSSRDTSQTWTRDGLILDRLMIIPGVADGEALLYSREKTAALPVFRADMLPNEIEELVESTIVKLFGEGSAAVDTRNLRPQSFGEIGGFTFDLEVQVTESPDYGGIAGAFVEGGKLNLIMYFAARPYYFDKHRADVEALILSATLQANAVDST